MVQLGNESGNVENTLCFVLHSRPYKDTSAIVELLSQDYGRISVIYKGVQSSKQSAKSRILQPFQPLLASWVGSRELKSGRRVEQTGVPYWLSGKKLYSGMYINELLMRLLHRDAPAEGIFEFYQMCLADLHATQNIEVPLRQFEWRLLAAIGYQIPCAVDANSGAPIVADAYYRYEPNNGFVYDSAGRTNDGRSVVESRANVFSGALLLAIENGHLEEPILPAAKRLMRLVLAPHIGQNPLESKKLFRKLIVE